MQDMNIGLKSRIEELKSFVLNKINSGEWSNEPKYTQFKQGFEYAKRLMLEGFSEFKKEIQ